MIRTILKRAASYAKNASLFARQALSRNVGSERGPIVVFDVSDPRYERYFYCLVKFFDIAGYRVRLRFRPGLLLNLRNYSDLVYGIDGLRIVGNREEKGDLLITDCEELVEKGAALLIDADYMNPSKSPNGFIFPYSMHPLIYHTGRHETVAELRTTAKNMRIFSYFAKLENYRRNEMAQRFGKMDRKLVGDVVYAFRNRDATRVLTTESDRKVLADEPIGLAVASDIRIPFSDWLATLARSSFFIAAPGVLMPYCHNLIEAMAVGSVPITEYPEMFDPPLTDGVNCLSFSGAEELRQKVEKALEMPEEEVARMRKAAVAYYDEYFDPSAAVRRLEERLPGLDRIYLLAGHLSVEKMRKRTAALKGDS